MKTFFKVGLGVMLWIMVLLGYVHYDQHVVHAQDQTLDEVVANNGQTIYVSNDYRILPDGTIEKEISIGESLFVVRTATDGTETIETINKDHLGSSSIITDPMGKLVAHLQNYPYGQARNGLSPNAPTRQFTGQVNDVDTGLYYYNQRYYDPMLGRFISADPLVVNGVRVGSQTQNLYSYTLNNPLNYIDPTGLRELTTHETKIASHMKDIANNAYLSGASYSGDDWWGHYSFYNDTIDALPDNGDPEWFTIMNDAVFKWYDNQMEYTDWSTDSYVKSNYYDPYSGYKCGGFVAEVLLDAVNYKNDMHGWFSTRNPVARDWTNGAVKNFSSVKDEQPGNVISFDYLSLDRSNQYDHVGINFRNGFYISARQGRAFMQPIDGVMISKIPDYIPYNFSRR